MFGKRSALSTEIHLVLPGTMGSYRLLISCLISTLYLLAWRTAIIPPAQGQAQEEKYGQGTAEMAERMVQMLDMMSAANSTDSEPTEAHRYSLSQPFLI